MITSIWPSVVTALLVVAVTGLVLGSVAWFFVKVVRWPSARSVRKAEKVMRERPNSENSPFLPADATFVVGFMVSFFAAFALVVGWSHAAVGHYRPSGEVVDVHSCARERDFLWLSFRCDATVRIVDARAHGDVPGRGRVTVYATERLEAGAPVQVKGYVKYSPDRDLPEFYTGSQVDRPHNMWGGIAGLIVAWVLAFRIGRWWTRSRPQPYGGGTPRYPQPDPYRDRDVRA